MKDNYIVFALAGTAYAVPSQAVAHIEMVDQITRVPNAPHMVDGVVFSRGEVVPAIEKMLSTPAPVILDVIVDKDECVFPMVPAGGANTDMILAPPSRETREKAEKSQTGF